MSPRYHEHLWCHHRLLPRHHKRSDKWLIMSLVTHQAAHALPLVALSG